MRTHTITIHSLVTLLAFSSSAAFAQLRPQAPRAQTRWEVEFHGAIGATSTPTDGTGALPPAGDTFATVNGRTTRHATSWYFGDGALLMNQINAGFTGAALGRIVPLDPVLQGAGGQWDGGAGFGARVSYGLRPRLSLEFTIDAPRGRLALTPELRAGVDASRSSFLSAWDERTGLISTGGGIVFTNPTVTSTATLTEGSARELFMTGTVNYTLAARGRLRPYVTGGIGSMTTTGDAPSIKVVGNYRFTSLNLISASPFLVNETDTVTVRVVPSRTQSLAGVLGGGVKWDQWARGGIRIDVRAYVSANAADIVIDAGPAIATSGTVGVITSTTQPSMQFSTLPSTTIQSTLSGPPVNAFKTFSGGGTGVHVSLSAGYFLRF